MTKEQVRYRYRLYIDGQWGEWAPWVPVADINTKALRSVKQLLNETNINSIIYRWDNDIEIEYRR